MVTAALGYLSFLLEPVTSEFTGSREAVYAKVNAQPFAVTAEDPHIISQEFKGKEPLLIMVIIRAKSSIDVKRLRGTHIDIFK